MTNPHKFKVGRYEDIPNSTYHAANGISSSMIKDARISLMYYHSKYIAKTIERESTEALTFGSLVHTLALEPEKLESEFNIEPIIPEGTFTTADSMKSFIKSYNETQPKTEQIKLTGKKEELQASIKSVNPSAVFADDIIAAWKNPDDKRTCITQKQMIHGKAIQKALHDHHLVGPLLRHKKRTVECSYFDIDEGTGLEVRVRPDLELDIGSRICFDLKTISMGTVKQATLPHALHREIINRDYHISAALYCDVADFDQFFWIFVNKDVGYHWIAVIEASTETLELGRVEYKKTLRDIKTALSTDVWPAPITQELTDQLTDFEMRQLEHLLRSA